MLLSEQHVSSVSSAFVEVGSGAIGPKSLSASSSAGGAVWRRSVGVPISAGETGSCLAFDNAKPELETTTNVSNAPNTSSFASPDATSVIVLTVSSFPPLQSIRYWFVVIVRDIHALES